MEITIKPLSEALIPDFLHFFDRIAFTDNPGWSGCYCYYYHFDGQPQAWEQRDGLMNREAAVELIRAGKLRGYLAYDACASQPVGWINVNDKENYPRLVSNNELWDHEAEKTPATAGSRTAGFKTAAIVCFIIAPRYRRQGIATKLLEEVLTGYTHQGYDYIEAYPVKGAQTAAHLYHGPAPMYQKAGFTFHRELEHFNILRKKLRD